MSNKNFIIITGMSGAGKTSALKSFEDIGYYIVDNIPLMLLPKFMELTIDYETKLEKVALTADIRSFTKENLYDIINYLKKKYNITILFLEAQTDILLRRFEETRRKHPLNDNMVMAIKKEREMLLDIKDISDLIIDTSNMNIHSLRMKIEDCFSVNSEQKINIFLQSFGFKYGIPPESDIVFDVRFVKNPYFVESLKDLTGFDESVRQYVLEDNNAELFLNKITDIFTFLLPLYISEDKKYLTVSMGCTGGKHRSVVLTNELFNRLINLNIGKISIMHRDIEKDGL
ncbi:MAG: RNase adapter RapZ [Deferribacterota bacterium]|nr:RNase adapter RapZ [Deferribacterota bacterium]